MNLLVPTALLLLLLAIPILALYLLKLRRREVPISSTLLWEQVLRDRQTNAPWQRLKRSLLLLLQLLILAALVFALARPAVPVPGVSSRSVVVVLDGSASMNAQDIRPSRFLAGRAAVDAIITGLPPGARITLILAGIHPELLVSGEAPGNVVRRALAAAHPSQGASDWPAAFALAAGSAAALTTGHPGEPPEILIVSDGGIPPGAIPPLPGRVRYIPLGQVGENLAVRALAPRAAPSGLELFTSVANYGRAQRAALLSIYRDGRLIHSQFLSVPPGEPVDVILEDLPMQPNPPGETIFEARLSSPAGNPAGLDPFPLDDTAQAVYTQAGEGQALLASATPAGNLFIEQILAALPGVKAYRALPDETGQFRFPDPAANPFALYVLDGTAPTPLPPGNLLMVDPPSNPLFTVGEVFTGTLPAQVADHPLTRGLAWANIHIRQAHSVKPPAWAQVLIGAPGGPLVFAGEQAGRRVAVLTFDLHDSDLPLQVAYPILMARLVEYLHSPGPIDPQVQASGLRPGIGLNLRPPLEADGVEIDAPSGQIFRLMPGDGDLIFSEALELGVYTIRYPGAPFLGEAHFAVNLFDPRESDIRPAGTLETPGGTLGASPPGEIGQRELWPWLAGAALITLLVEWWVYQRQQGLPGRSWGGLPRRLGLRLKGR